MNNEAFFRFKKEDSLPPLVGKTERREILRTELSKYPLLPNRTSNALLRACYHHGWPLTVADIIGASDRKLLSLRDIGEKALQEVREIIG